MRREVCVRATGATRLLDVLVEVLVGDRPPRAQHWRRPALAAPAVVRHHHLAVELPCEADRDLGGPAAVSVTSMHNSEQSVASLINNGIWGSVALSLQK